jgi:hypothetical protein
MLCSKKMILPSKFNVKLCSGSGFPKFSGGVKKKLGGGGAPPCITPMPMYALTILRRYSTLLDAALLGATLTLLNGTLMLL